MHEERAGGRGGGLSERFGTLDMGGLLIFFH